MKAILFTTEELNTLKTALKYTYNKKLDQLSINRSIMSEDEVKTLLQQANKFDDLTLKLK